jgi:hypothetical protein
VINNAPPSLPKRLLANRTRGGIALEGSKPPYFTLFTHAGILFSNNSTSIWENLMKKTVEEDYKGILTDKRRLGWKK